MNRIVFAGLMVVSLCWGSCLSSEVQAVEAQHVCRYCDAAAFQRMARDRSFKSHGERKYAPARYIDLVHLKLDVTPDFKNRSVAGTATLEFVPIAKPLTELKLDAIDLQVTAVRGSVPITDFTVTREDLTVTFSRPLKPGEKCWLEVDYSAEPTQGLYFRTEEQGYPVGDTHLYTQGEPQLGRHWFPSHDYPNERCTTEILCHVPAPMTVLSNGRLVSEKVAGAMKTVHWRQEQPHACYLITLVAGHFSKLEDLNRKVPLAFYTQPTVAEYGANSFKNTADIMDFFNAEIGVPFPWHKYFQVTVHDFGFGGMENTSMTTLANRTIGSSASENLRGVRIRTLDAHEMAHQWFGDYVTCKDWSHLWLNEGFATYYSHLYEGHKLGRDALLYSMYDDARGNVLKKHKDPRPIVYNRYNRPLEQFDFRAYPKGSWVLHMLRSQLGEELYRKAIKTYLERHALTSVVTTDLIKVIEEVSGRSYERFFDQWVFHPRHPSLKVSYKWLADKKLAKVTVQQTQKVTDQVLLFEFPTVLRFIVDGQVVDHSVEITQEKQDFYVPLAKQPTVVRFDPEYTVLADVKFNKSDKLLMAQLKNESDMIGRILAVRDLADREKKSGIKVIGETLRSDPFFGVRKEAARALGEIEDKAALAELLTAVNESNSRVRVKVVEMIGKRFSREAEAALLQIVEQEKNPTVASEAILALGNYRTEAAQSAVQQQLRSVSFRNELAIAAIEALGRQRDPAASGLLMQVLRDRSAEWTSWGLRTGLDELATIGRHLEDAQAREEIERFIREHLEHPMRPVRIAAVDALGELGDHRSSAVLEALADEESSDPLAEAAVRALKKLRRLSPLVPKELTKLRGLVDDLKDGSEKLREELDELKEQGKSAKKAGEDDTKGEAKKVGRKKRDLDIQNGRLKIEAL